MNITFRKLTVFALSLLLCISLFPLQAAAQDKADVDAVIDSIPSDWPEAPAIKAQAAILMDADSGEILYAKNATDAIYPASTTKLMTALLTLENASLNDIVDFDYTAVNIPAGSSHIGMRRGEQMELKDCLYGLLLPSANEVANALAQHVSGYISTFVVQMNERAYQLGAVNTNFANANGLHEENHYTCAYDLALIMQACAENAVFVEIASQQSYVHHADELLNKDIPMTNTNMMIRTSSEYYNENVICGKTGHTDESGYNLVIYAEKDGTRLISVVIGCENGNQYVSTQSLLDYGFNYFHRVLPAELDTSLSMDNSFTASPLKIPTPEAALLTLDSTDSILLPDEVTFDRLEKEVIVTDEGRMINYTYNGYPMGSVHLKTSSANDTNPIFTANHTQTLVQEEVDDLVVIDGWLIVFILLMIIFLIVFIHLAVKLSTPKKRYMKR